MTLLLRKIISGGQTGADQGALYAAQALGLTTGGWMPRGFRTEAGPRPEMAELFGLSEHSSEAYQPRTKVNVLYADGTLIFGRQHSPGCLLTQRYARELNRPIYGHKWPPSPVPYPGQFLEWLKAERITILNVAGNREEKNPGIFKAVQQFLIENLKEHLL